jgi:hypothetical protein
LSDYWLDEFILLLVAGGILLAVELWWGGRRRAKVELKEITKGERIGFSLTAKGGTLYKLEVIYSMVARPFFSDSTKLDLYDKNGNLYIKDYVLAGDSVSIFPFHCEHVWAEEGGGETYTLKVLVYDLNSHLPRVEYWFEGIKPPQGTNSYTPEPRQGEQIPFEGALIIKADGWRKEKTHVYSLTVRPLLWGGSVSFDDDSKPMPNSIEDWNIYYHIGAKELKLREWLS